MPQPRPSLKKLDFSEKLIQSGKKETTDALLKRLKTLHIQLKSLEQDTTDVKSLNHVRKPLVDPIIMHHKDRGVKAYAACCQADLLRLYAPDAPYSQNELRDIFQFMINQITSNLKVSSAVKPLQPSRSRSGNVDSQSQLPATMTGAASQRITDAAYYNEYYFLLENLATIRSVVLATDVPDGDDIVTSFFEGFVEIVRPDMSKNLIRHMYDILAVLIEEAQSIPAGIMDVIIKQFELQKDKDTRNATAFQLIQNVCNRTAQKLHRAIYAHFSSIQLEHGRSQNASSSFETLADSHDLIIVMHKHCPGLLDGFIAQLEENLRAADEVPLRQLSTRTLGTMFGTRPVVGGRAKDLAEAYPGAWTAWLGRKVDKALPVRLAWVESARGVLVGQPDLRKIMESEMVDRVQDAEEKVRAALCHVFGQLDYETALHHIDVETLRAIGGRASVRMEAAITLCKLWNLAYAAIEAGDQASITQFAWIPAALLAALTRRDATVELRHQVTSIFKAQILPLPTVDQIDEQSWTERLLVVYCHLDEGGRRAVERLTGLKGYSRGNSPFRAFIDFCEENNGGVIEGDEKLVRARLDFVINAISRQMFADPAKAKKDLERFAEANDARLYKLVKGCVDTQSDLRQIVKAKSELLRRIEQQYTDILETFTTFIDNAAWNVLNHSAIPALIKRLQKAESPSSIASTSANPPMTMSRASYELLGLISKECPPMFKSHVDELVLIMADRKNELLSEAGLRGLASVCKADPGSAPSEQRAVDRAMQKALEGTPRQAKFATRFLAYGRQSEKCEKLLEEVMVALLAGEDDNLLSHLRVLSELALSAPQVFEQKAEEVSAFLKSEILDKESPITEDDTDAEWVPETQLDTLDRAKLLALRIFTHRALAHARSSTAHELAEMTFALLRAALVGKEEEESLDDDERDSRASHHMKLRAGLCLLKLANAKVYDKAMSWELFESVASVCQAAVFQVRNAFLLKLGEILPTQRLLPRWNVLPVLAALDPDTENVQVAASILHQIVRGAQSLPMEQRTDRIELQLSRLLLVLSHHPDLEMSEDMVKAFARYIELFIDCFATRDNISLIMHIASKIKTVRDPMRDDSENLYCLAELAQIIIKNRAQQHGWPLSSYPGKIRLPRDGFLNLHDPKQVSDNVRRSYLKEEVNGWVKMLGKRGAVAAPPRERKSATQRTRQSASPSTKKRRAANKKSQAAKRRRRDDDEDDDESEESEDETGDDEDEETDEGGMDVEAAESSALSEDDGEALVGRGGRRGAKSKAKKAVARTNKKSKTKTSSKKARKSVGTEESDLTDDE